MRSIARLRPALVAPVAVLALVLAGCSADDPVATDPAAEPSTSENQDPSTEPSEDPEPSDDDSSDAGTTTTAAYFIGDTERAGPRLYREFQRASGEPLVSRELWLDMGGGRTQRQLTDADGRLHLELPLGTYSLTARPFPFLDGAGTPFTWTSTGPSASDLVIE